jgi:hypothetical protein
MKRPILVLAILCSVTGVASALAEVQTATANPVEEAAAAERESAAPEKPGMTRGMPGKGMMHGGGQHGKGKGGMMHGGGRHGKEGGDRHRQVLQRLDMIEARMAKIEAMLEILLRR